MRGDIRRMSASPPPVTQPPAPDAEPGPAHAIGFVARPRLEELQRLTSALVRLSTMEEIGAFSSRELAELAGAATCWMGRVTEDGAFIETIGVHGVRASTVDEFWRLSLADDFPMCQALRSGRADWYADKESLFEAFPAHAAKAREIEREASAFIPLLVGDEDSARCVGGLSLGFRERHAFDDDTRSFLLTLAQQCAQALDRARLHESERAARREAEAAKMRAERAAYRAGRLLHLASSLSRALTREDVAAVILDEAMPAFHATGAWIVHEGSGTAFDILGMRGVREDLIRPLAREGHRSRSLSAEVARTGEPQFLTVGSREQWSRLYPDSVDFVMAHGFGVLAAMPLRYGGATHGVLAFGLPAGQLADEDREAMLTFAAQCSQSLERARLHSAERSARHAAEHAASRTARLQRLTAALSQALTLEEISDILTRQGRAAFDASAAAVYLLDAARRALEMVEAEGFSTHAREAFARVPIDAAIPVADVARTGEPLFLGPRAELLARYPALAESIAVTGSEGIAVLPLRASGDVMGALAFAFDEPCDFGAMDREFAQAIATQCAQAMERAELAAERARLSEAQASATRRAEFLADASRALAIPLDRDEVLRRLATLPIATFADYAIVYRMEADGLIHRVARAHVSEERERVLDALERECPIVPASEEPASRVMRTHETMYMPAMTVETLRATAPSAHYAELVGALNPCSGIVVPLIARGRALGALVLAMADRSSGGSGRHFTRHDAALAESLAERAALALDSLLVLGEAERARAESEHANRAKSDFLATMSHELRTPLNAISGYVQLLDMELHGPVTPAQRNALGRIGRAQERLLGLINDILNFARLEAGRVEYDVRETDVAEVVTEVAGLMEPQLSARELTLEVDLIGQPGAEAPHVRADRDKLAQVLLNLLSNAVKFTGAGGRVRIELAPHARDGARAELRVVDTGIGISAEKQQTIFEPFVQLGRGLSSGVEGTGLGLAISRDLVRGMGGELTVDSSPGVGSAFRIELLRA